MPVFHHSVAVDRYNFAVDVPLCHSIAPLPLFRSIATLPLPLIGCPATAERQK